MNYINNKMQDIQIAYIGGGSRKLVDGKEKIELKSTGEEGLLLIKALCGLTFPCQFINHNFIHGNLFKISVNLFPAGLCIFGTVFFL